jgi:hypothetical protein
MNSRSPSASAYRRLGFLTLAHAVVVFGLAGLLLTTGLGKEWLLRLWVALVTLWFLWLLVLGLHRGRSLLRFTIWISGAALVLFPSWRFYNQVAPEAFGLSQWVSMNPWSIWQYYSAYLAGQAEARKDVATGVLIIEQSGFGAGGGHHEQRILRDRFGIEIRAVAGCLVNERIMGHQEGYNSVSESEIERRFGLKRVEAAREEGHRLQYRESERHEQSVRDLTKRLSSLTEGGKVTTKLIEPYLDSQSLDDFETQPDLVTFVHAVEKCVIEAVPEEAPASDLRIYARMAPNSRPSFELSGTLNSAQSTGKEISNRLNGLPAPQWSKGSLSIGFNFLIRSPRE